MVSSLDALSRQQACASLAAVHPRAVMVVQDLLDDGTVVRRTFRPGLPVERETAWWKHGCPSCAARLDLVPTLARLLEAGEGHVVVGLPPAVPTATAIQALGHQLEEPPVVESATPACSPGSVVRRRGRTSVIDRGTCPDSWCSTPAPSPAPARPRP